MIFASLYLCAFPNNFSFKSITDQTQWLVLEIIFIYLQFSGALYRDTIIICDKALHPPVFPFAAARRCLPRKQVPPNRSGIKYLKISC